MANRHWVGGSATWDATAGTKWSTTSGGAGGSAVPTASDDVFFDGSSGVITVTLGAGQVCNNLTFTGFTGTFTDISGNTLTISGSLTMGAGMTFTPDFGTRFVFNSTTSKTITTNGINMGAMDALELNGTGTWTLQDTYTATGGRFVITQGTLTTNNQTINASFSSDSASTCVVNLGSSTINAGIWNLVSATGLTVNASTSVIKITGATFGGDGHVYNEVQFNRVGIITITGSSTFTTFKATAGSAQTIKFTAGTIQTISSSFIASGTVGNIITLQSTSAGSAASLSKSSGTVTVDYCSIKDSTATGGATWNATNSIDVSGNTGWNFSTINSGAGFLDLF